MQKSHRPYPPEFRRRWLHLVRCGRTPGSCPREFEQTAPGDLELGSLGRSR